MKESMPQALDSLEVRLRSIRENIDLIAPIIALVALLLVFSIITERFLTIQNLVDNVLKNAMILLLVSLAGTFPILQQSLDLSVAQLVVVTGILTATLAPDFGLFTLPLVLLAGLALGAMNGILYTKLKVPSFLVTLGTLSVFRGIALTVSDGQSILFNDPSVEAVASGSYIPGLPNLVLWGGLAYILAIVVAKKSLFGRYSYAIGDNEQVVRLSGVRATRYKIYAFALSGLLCAAGGALLASRISGAGPAIGGDFLLTSITAIVVGGTPISGGEGGPEWTLVGVLIIAILQNGMSLMFIDSSIQQIILGAIIIAAVAINIKRGEGEDIVK